MISVARPVKKITAWDDHRDRGRCPCHPWNLQHFILVSVKISGISILYPKKVRLLCRCHPWNLHPTTLSLLFVRYNTTHRTLSHVHHNTFFWDYFKTTQTLLQCTKLTMHIDYISPLYGRWYLWYLWFIPVTGSLGWCVMSFATPCKIVWPSLLLILASRQLFRRHDKNSHRRCKGRPWLGQKMNRYF